MTIEVVTVLLVSIVEHVYGQPNFGRYRGYGAFSGFGGSGRYRGYGAFSGFGGSGRGTGGIFGGGSRGSLAGRLGGGSHGGGSGFAGGITMGGPGFGVGSFRDRGSSGIDMGGGGGGLSMMGGAGRWWCTCRSKVCRKWELTVDKNCKLPVIPWYWRTCCQWFPWWVTNRNYVGLSGASNVGGGSFEGPIVNGGSGSSGSNSGSSGFGSKSSGGSSGGSGAGSRDGAVKGTVSGRTGFKGGNGGGKPSY